MAVYSSIFWGGGGMGYWPYYKLYSPFTGLPLQNRYSHNKVASPSCTQVKLWTPMKALFQTYPFLAYLYISLVTISPKPNCLLFPLSHLYSKFRAFSWSLNHTHSLLALPSKLLRNVNTCKDKERTNIFKKQRSRGRGLNVQTRQYNSTIQALPEHEVLFFNIAE